MWTDGSIGAEMQIPVGYRVLGELRKFSSVAVAGNSGCSTELRGGLGSFSARNPFLEGSLRFKSKKSQKKSKKKKVPREERKRLQMLQRERKLRKLRMSPEERLEFRIQKAQKKIALHEQGLKKFALPDQPEKPHDPEVLTPEQLHALKKLGYKNKNYVPVGRRGIYGGVIQNMHLHWKKHETVRVDCDNFPKDEVRSMAKQLEKLSGGKVIDIHQGTTIIMYRGKNYKQPKKLIPDNMLDKRKALLKSLHDQSLKSLREYVAKLEVELTALRAQMALEAANSPQEEDFDGGTAAKLSSASHRIQDLEDEAVLSDDSDDELSYTTDAEVELDESDDSAMMEVDASSDDDDDDESPDDILEHVAFQKSNWQDPANEKFAFEVEEEESRNSSSPPLQEIPCERNGNDSSQSDVVGPVQICEDDFVAPSRSRNPPDSFSEKSSVG